MDSIKTRSGNKMWFCEHVKGKKKSTGPKYTDVREKNDKNDEWLHLKIHRSYEKHFLSLPFKKFSFLTPYSYKRERNNS